MLVSFLISSNLEKTYCNQAHFILRIAWRGNERGKTTVMSVSKKPGRVQFKSRLKEVHMRVFNKYRRKDIHMFINGNNHIRFILRRVRLLRVLGYTEYISFSERNT